MKHILKQSGYQPNVRLNNNPYLFFGGTSYLGLNHHPEYLDIFANGLKIWGLNNGASRNNNITLAVYEEAENLLAKKYQAQEAVTFSSGWLAAKTAVEVLQQNRELIYLNDIHPALSTKNQDILNDADAVKLINSSKQQDFLLVSNSVNNINPQIFDFQQLSEISIDKNIVLLLDHSHGFGFLEENWLRELKNLPANIHLILCGSLAKGLSLDAGVVMGDAKYIQEIKGSLAFNGASPCSPSVLYTYINSTQIIAEAQNKLSENLHYLTQQLSENDFYWVKDFPVILIKNKNIAEKINKANIVFTSFPYPHPDSDILNRLVIMASHTQKELDYLLASFS